jgi:hypothetical protein
MSNPKGCCAKTAKAKNGDRWHSFVLICAAAAVLHLGVPGASGQTNKYLYTGSFGNITLFAGKYNVTAYGAEGSHGGDGTRGGLGAEMEGQFVFGTTTNLLVLIGGVGLTGSGSGGGGGGTFVLGGITPLVIAGGGGGCFQTTDGGPGLTGTSGGNGGGFYAGVGGSGGSGGGGGQYIFGGGGGGGYSGDGMNSSDNGVYDGGYGGLGFIYGGLGGGNYGGNDNMGGFGGGGGGGSVGSGGGGGYSGGGGGQYGSGNGGGGGGGGSYIGPSAVLVVKEASGVASPDGSPNGEIIITAVQVPLPSALPLFMSRSGNTITIYWQNEFGWSLQQSLKPASGWTTRTTGITTLNGTNYINLTSPKGTLFFRLAY